MDLRKELIDFTARLNDWSIAIPDDIRDCVINEHIQSINCASDETQADRQNEQTKEFTIKQMESAFYAKESQWPGGIDEFINSDYCK